MHEQFFLAYSRTNSVELLKVARIFLSDRLIV